MATILNLTPHAINIFNVGDCSFEQRTRSYRLVGHAAPALVIFPASNLPLPRCSQEEMDCEPIGDVPTCRIVYGAVDNLPAPQDGVFYVVSALTASAAKAADPDRTDLLIPARMVRDDAGRILGCLALSRA